MNLLLFGMINLHIDYILDSSILLTSNLGNSLRGIVVVHSMPSLATIYHLFLGLQRCLHWASCDRRGWSCSWGEAKNDKESKARQRNRTCRLLHQENQLNVNQVIVHRMRFIFLTECKRWLWTWIYQLNLRFQSETFTLGRAVYQAIHVFSWIFNLLVFRQSSCQWYSVIKLVLLRVESITLIIGETNKQT